ncbi:MAG: LysM domain-containing protein [Arthrobacter sp.]
MKKPAGSATRTDAVGAAAILLLGVLLWVVGSGLLEQWQQSSARRQGPHTEDLLGAGAAISGTALVGWWLLSLLLAGAAAVLDRMGKLRAAALTRRFSPEFMQRLVLAALSAQLLAGPAAHGDVTAPGPEWAPTQEHIAAARADPADSTSPPRADPPIEEGLEDALAPPAMIEPGWQPAAPVISPGLLAAPATRSADDTGTEAAAVTVIAGDTLWDIAAAAMGPGASDVEIAMQWPQWYEANRAIIGQNPDVLLPGQILQPPSAAQPPPGLRTISAAE